MITLTIDNAEVHVGRFVSGNASWTFQAARQRTVSIAAVWTAVAAHAHCPIVAHHFTHVIHDKEGVLPFHFRLPLEGPISFAGKFTSVEWIIRAEADDGAGVDRVELPFKVTPAPTQVVIAPPAQAHQRPNTFAYAAIFTLAALVIYLFSDVRDLLAPAPAPAPSMRASDVGGWLSSYRVAVGRQQVTHQPMLVYFRTKRCRPCKQLDAIFRSPAAERRLASLVRVQIDPRSDPDVTRQFDYKPNESGVIVVEPDGNLRYIPFVTDETTLLNEIDPRHGSD